MTKLKFASLEDAEQNFAMLDLIPDTHAWVKNAEGKFVYGNRLFLQRFGISSMQGLVGKCDYDLAPTSLAELYTQDDSRVLEGNLVTDRLELINGKDSSGDWFLTSKWPIYDLDNRVVGTFGISRHLNRTEGTTIPYQQLRAPVDYICQNFASKLSVEALASACSISVSALERRFRKHFNKTPRQYINEVRLDNARHLLMETDKSVGIIALETGFSDHSHFTRAFSKHYGVPPGKVRKDKLSANRPDSV